MGDKAKGRNNGKTEKKKKAKAEGLWAQARALRYDHGAAVVPSYVLTCACAFCVSHKFP